MYLVLNVFNKKNKKLLDNQGATRYVNLSFLKNVLASDITNLQSGNI